MSRPRSLPHRVAVAVLVASTGTAVADPTEPTAVPPAGQLGPQQPCPPPPSPPTVIRYEPTVTFLPGPFGLVPYAPPLIVASGPVVPLVAVPPPLPIGLVPMPPVPGFGPYPIAPPPILAGPMSPFGPQGLDRPQGQGGMVDPEPRPVAPRRDPVSADRVVELLTFGDRLFRAGSLRHAERRYRQALAAAPLAAAPRFRMTQLAIVRGSYGEAADWLREALLAEPSWLARAIDVQSLYAEPSDFHDVLAALEAHVQADPADRDAWLVLGAQLYLSGRVDRAVEVFHRLADRRPDATLAALMDASGADR